MHHVKYHVFFYDFGKVMFHLYRILYILFLWGVGVRELFLGVFVGVEERFSILVGGFRGCDGWG